MVVLLGSGRVLSGQPGRTLPPPWGESEVGTLRIMGGGSHTPVGWAASLGPGASARASTPFSLAAEIQRRLPDTTSPLTAGGESPAGPWSRFCTARSGHRALVGYALIGRRPHAFRCSLLPSPASRSAVSETYSPAWRGPLSFASRCNYSRGGAQRHRRRCEHLPASQVPADMRGRLREPLRRSRRGAGLVPARCVCSFSSPTHHLHRRGQQRITGQGRARSKSGPPDGRRNNLNT